VIFGYFTKHKKIFKMKYINIFSVLIFLMSVAIKAQDVDSTKRNISLMILNNKERPVDRIIVRNLSNTQAGMTGRSGLFVFTEMSDRDTISVILPRYGETIIPVAGMDSIVVKLRSARRYSYVNNDGQVIIVDKNKTSPTDMLDVPALLKQNTYRSLVDLLQGRVAGLNITTSGSFGQTSANIRGERSFLLSSEPLVVLNGMVIGTLNDANSIINVHDIKTIEVLKGASEWGARGANGVIIITTK